MKWIKGIFNNLISGLLVSFLGSSAVVTFIGKWIAGTSVFKFLTNEHPIQGWVIVLIISVILAFLLMLVIGILRNRPYWKEKKDYLSQGLEWTLTEEFFLNYEYLTLDKTGPQFIRACIIGPFCPICKVDVNPIVSGGSFICFNGHDLKNTEAYRILNDQRQRFVMNTSNFNDYWDVIRSRVYIEAQGKARKGLLQ